MNPKQHAMAIASAMLLLSGTTIAHTTPSQPPNEAHRNAAPMATSSGKLVAMRDRKAALESEKAVLERKLQAGDSRADYRKIIESNGYRISSINADKTDYLEYEVVKGDHSFEVQLDFDKVATKATKIDVTTNLWRADATKRMLEDAKYRHSGALTADPDSRFSDRRFIKSWTDEKDRLEKALPLNLPVAEYKGKIEQLGYKITAVNNREKDYVEYEIAKGDNSYEVQIDLDTKTQLAKKIDVTSNLWEAPATDRATASNRK